MTMQTVQPETPSYLVLFSKVHDLLSTHLKGWAFRVSLSGAVQVHNKRNVLFVRQLLKNAGLDVSAEWA